MIYLDSGATSLWKPPEVKKAVVRALETCGNPGRGGHPAAMAAAQTVYACREAAGKLFSCRPEQVVMTGNCTQGLNIAIRTLAAPGDRVVISGFEHNAVTRPLHALGADIVVAGRKLFDWEDTLEAFDAALTPDTRAAVFTQVSNVFGYILPVQELSRLCRERQIPFILDAAQSAGMMEVNFEALQPDFLAMPGHKGLLGPQGTGLLLCGRPGKPLIQGGTGSLSREMTMPDFLPDALEAGTLNVPGIAGLREGLEYVGRMGPEAIGRREHALVQLAAEGLEARKLQTFRGPHQAGTLSFLPREDPETFCGKLADLGFALRAGLHCAPLAHESGGTGETGTVRVSVGPHTKFEEIQDFLQAVSKLSPGEV